MWSAKQVAKGVLWEIRSYSLLLWLVCLGNLTPHVLCKTGKVCTGQFDATACCCEEGCGWIYWQFLGKAYVVLAHVYLKWRWIHQLSQKDWRSTQWGDQLLTPPHRWSHYNCSPQLSTFPAEIQHALLQSKKYKLKITAEYTHHTSHMILHHTGHMISTCTVHKPSSCDRSCDRSCDMFCPPW